MRGLAFGRHGRVPSSAGRAVARKGQCGQSSAATTSASDGGDRRRAGGRRARAAAATSAGPCLPVQDEDPAQAGPLRRQDVGAHVVADHRDLVAAKRVAAGRADLAPQRRRRPRRKNAGDGLPMICARDARSRTRARRRRRPASSVGPSGVSHHGLRCMPISSRAAADEPERDVQVVVGQRLGRIADHDGRGARSGRRAASSASAAAGRRTRSGVVGGEHVQRLRPGRRGPCRRPRPTAADWNRSAGTGRPVRSPQPRQRRAADAARCWSRSGTGSRGARAPRAPRPSPAIGLARQRR